MEQLQAVLEAAREKEWEHKKFLAAIKGINLDGNEEKVDKVQEIKDRVAAEQEGMSLDEYEWKQAGLGFEPDEEE